ncbi:MAG: EamA family transporter [Stappia sp.]|uniref:EamA family transporter n=1 Tax=Stappia sp. TaxID=1870903 RepID=UPI000C554C74|nr:EamA family transporter [Stappia sp.]MAA99035.1 EamA family transporter [Stappia sp.]MBM18453.1 EamA family transporter [Stappia sp.]
MNRTKDIALTALAPAIWGSSYYVATTFLPDWHPLLVAFLRALPAGLLLLLLVRQMPRGIWWSRVFLLGALNFSVFWAFLFIAAYRLPGGVAATVGAIQPLLVLMLSRPLLGTRVAPLAFLAALAGIGGVAMLILTPGASLDPLGLAAGLGGAASMALGTVLSRRWQPPAGPLTFTAWQLVAGGVLLLPAALAFAPLPEAVTAANLAGLAYLGLIGAAFTYLVWFRGLARLEPAIVSPLGFLSPVTAVALGLLLAGETLTGLQVAGIAVIFASIIAGQRAQARRAGVPVAAPSSVPSSASATVRAG